MPNNPTPPKRSDGDAQLRGPNRIWLQDVGSYGPTWCEDRIDDNDVEYVRADLVATAREADLRARLDAAERERTRAVARELEILNAGGSPA